MGTTLDVIFQAYAKREPIVIGFKIEALETGGTTLNPKP